MSRNDKNYFCGKKLHVDEVSVHYHPYKFINTIMNDDCTKVGDIYGLTNIIYS